LKDQHTVCQGFRLPPSASAVPSIRIWHEFGSTGVSGWRLISSLFVASLFAGKPEDVFSRLSKPTMNSFNTIRLVGLVGLTIVIAVNFVALLMFKKSTASSSQTIGGWTGFLHILFG